MRRVVLGDATLILQRSQVPGFSCLLGIDNIYLSLAHVLVFMCCTVVGVKGV